MDYHALADQIKSWAIELGFEKVRICDVDLSQHEAALQQWLDAVITVKWIGWRVTA